MNDPRGSIWRKWDLHIHTPSTKLNNNFKGATDAEKWESFITKLEQTDLSVIAPTNYFCIDGYQKILEYKRRGRLSNILSVYPNVEFRIQQPNRQGDFINLHVLFSDELTIEEINDFLNRIPLINSRTDSTQLHCNDRGLASAGYANALVDLKSMLNSLKTNFNETSS